MHIQLSFLWNIYLMAIVNILQILLSWPICFRGMQQAN